MAHVRVAAAVLLAACGTDPRPCTANIEPAITVRVVDAGTGEDITDGALGVVSDDAYTDSLRPAAFDAGQRVTLLRAADERPGTYGVFVERDGYQAVSLTAVEVTADECHVNTAALDLTMVPLGGP